MMTQSNTAHTKAMSEPKASGVTRRKAQTRRGGTRALWEIEISN